MLLKQQKTKAFSGKPARAREGTHSEICRRSSLTMNENGKRRKWTAAEKLRIVLAGMQPNVEVSELCRREGINPTQYYGWKKQLLVSADAVFDTRGQRRSPAGTGR